MSLVDALLARQVHPLRSSHAVDDVRRRINEQLSPPFGTRRAPLAGGWMRDGTARVQKQRERRYGNRPVMLVRLQPDGAGTAVNVTTQIDPFPVVITCGVLGGFGLFGYAQTSYGLTHGQGIFVSMFPFGFITIALVLLLLSLWPGSKAQVGTSLALIEYIVDAAPPGTPGATGAVSPYRPAFPTGNWSQDHGHGHGSTPPQPQPPPPPAPPVDLPPPPVPVFVPPLAVPEHRTFGSWLLGRQTCTLVTAYAIDECERRVDSARVPTSPFRSELGDDGALVLADASWNERPSVYEMRVRFTRESFGTRIDVTTQVSPLVARGTVVRWILVAALALATMTGAWSILPIFSGGFGPIDFFLSAIAGFFGPFALAALPVAYFNRRARGRVQAREKVATLERLLGATAAGDGPDAGVR